MVREDLRYAVRRLRAAPSFTIVAICTLALGIGANTAIFSVVNTLLFSPLAVTAPHELVNIYRIDAPGLGGPFNFTSYPDYQDIRSRQDVFSDVIAYSLIREALSADGAAQMVMGEAVSANYFDALGVRLALGRSFTADEGGVPRQPIVVISDRLWSRRFGRDRRVIGKVVKLAGHPLEVIGVAPPEFRGLNGGPIVPADIWLPLGTGILNRSADTRSVADRERALANREHGVVLLKGRLKPGVSFQQAQAAMKTLAAQLERAFPTPDADTSFMPTRRRFDLRRTTDVLLHETVDQFAIPVSAGVLAAVGLVLLIACTNLANLLLARGAARTSEIAVRLTLGASRFRIVKLLMIENVVVACLGGSAAFLSVVGLARFARYTPMSIGGVAIEVAPIVDATVFAFTVAVSIVTGLAFGLVPALRTSRPDIVRALAGDMILTTRARRFGVRNFLVVPQMAFSLFLLLVGALFVRSYLVSQRVDPGFTPDGSAMVTVNLRLHGYSEEHGRQFFRVFERDARALPGVSAAGLTDHVPFDGERDVLRVRLDNQPPSPDERRLTFAYARIDPGYLNAIGIRLRSGRDFSERDTASSPDVIIVSQTAATRFWPHQDPIGRTLFVTVRNGTPRSTEVVGVAGDTFESRLTERQQPFFYRPFAQDYSTRGKLVVRAANAAGVLDALRNLVRRQDPEVAIVEAKTMAAHMAEQVWQLRVAAVVLGLFGMLALGLASVGLYGVMAYVAAQRTREVGLRVALGATHGQVLRLMMRDGLIVVAAGGVVGILLALVAGQFLSKLLFGISGADVVTFTLVPLALALVALIACYIPAHRAARVDPMVALRQL